jgi:HK97 family phage portal protein
VGFWSWLAGTPSDGPVPEDYSSGDPDGLTLEGEQTFSRHGLPFIQPTPWSGWPSSWAMPNWGSNGYSSGPFGGVGRLVDTAWSCIDLNSSVLSSMPVYRLQNGKIASAPSWMTNPDPLVYSSWQEFAKQLFWDYHMGEAFVLPMVTGPDGLPSSFRVVPPWLMNVELKGGQREYKLGSADVSDVILHIRYQSSTVDARGHGPLEAVGARMTAAALIQRYAQNLVETGGTPQHWIGVDAQLTNKQAEDLLDQWVTTRTRHAGEPAVLGRGATLHQTSAMSARDMALVELEEFNEARISVALGVPPYLAGLPSGGDSLTYANVSQLFDFHDRSSLRPKVTAVMGALSGWALPLGESVELNRDEYTRPDFAARVTAYKTLMDTAVASGDPGAPAEIWTMIRAMERLNDEPSAVSLTGGYDT